MKLSEFFTLEEMTITQVRSVGNVPNALKLENLTRTAMKMDHIRRLLGRPIIVSSGYRSPEVNKIVGGSQTSDHMQGLAVDFICPGFGTVDEIAWPAVYVDSDEAGFITGATLVDGGKSIQFDS